MATNSWRAQFPNKPLMEFTSYQDVYEYFFYNEMINDHPELKDLSYIEAKMKFPHLFGDRAVEKKKLELDENYKAEMQRYAEKFPLEYERYQKILLSQARSKTDYRKKKAVEKKNKKMLQAAKTFENLISEDTHSVKSEQPSSPACTTEEPCIDKYREAVEHTRILVKRLKLDPDAELLILKSLHV